VEIPLTEVLSSLKLALAVEESIEVLDPCVMLYPPFSINSRFVLGMFSEAELMCSIIPKHIYCHVILPLHSFDFGEWSWALDP
jgi:hypothetical protein